METFWTSSRRGRARTATGICCPARRRTSTLRQRRTLSIVVRRFCADSSGRSPATSTTPAAGRGGYFRLLQSQRRDRSAAHPTGVRRLLSTPRRDRERILGDPADRPTPRSIRQTSVAAAPRLPCTFKDPPSPPVDHADALTRDIRFARRIWTRRCSPPRSCPRRVSATTSVFSRRRRALSPTAACPPTNWRCCMSRAANQTRRGERGRGQEAACSASARRRSARSRVQHVDARHHERPGR